MLADKSKKELNKLLTEKGQIVSADSMLHGRHLKEARKIRTN